VSQHFRCSEYIQYVNLGYCSSSFSCQGSNPNF